MIVALTGATGFVGRATLAELLARGHRVRALTRRQQPPQESVVWVEGSLDRTDSLERLTEGADAVLHVAGVVNGSREDFVRGNAEGTRNMIAAARDAGVRRFVHVSSLAAREPGLSDYGRSKERAEAAVTASDLDWSIVRPPGVYGPADGDMLDVFRMAKLGVMLLPPAGRVSLIHVTDLARLLVALVGRAGARELYECEDGIVGGLSHHQLARLIGAAVGRKPLAIALPAAVLKAAARLDRLLRGRSAKLTPDRASYLSHPDWTADPARRPPPELWTPQVPTPDGLAATAQWYRAEGLL